MLAILLCFYRKGLPGLFNATSQRSESNQKWWGLLKKNFLINFKFLNKFQFGFDSWYLNLCVVRSKLSINSDSWYLNLCVVRSKLSIYSNENQSKVKFLMVNKLMRISGVILDSKNFSSESVSLASDPGEVE